MDRLNKYLAHAGLGSRRHVEELIRAGRVAIDGVVVRELGPRVVDLVPDVGERVYTVGRLDEDSEGLILLTNDGELANRLMHPRYGVDKTYIVQVAGNPSHDDLHQLLKGVWLSDGHVHARRVNRLRHQGESTWVEIVLS